MSELLTTDLVSRLRQTAAAGYAGWDTARDAADQIERLRHEVNRLMGFMPEHDTRETYRCTECGAFHLRLAAPMPTVDPYTPRARKGPQGHPTAFEQAKQLEHSSDDVGGSRADENG